ncbi:hypothetical protein [Jannaschia rubra]|jgi:mercuric ion transport protein|uniref:Mercury ion transport protein n=1 Tax=Jannaschia rubra TaxID=282197 RepID=A0A0M6XTS0_9RHOB|nr:hypothetical protein [Jannaschia rubra]CTQ34480.1 hypothetical protein JAN5088_03276 [Jannaschia rubra]
MPPDAAPADAPCEPALNGPALLGIGGAGLAALLSASCCVLPLALSLVGLGGTWLTVLGPFVVWRVPILVAAGLVLAVAWIVMARRGLRRVRPRALVVAGLATVSLGLAATTPLWEQGAQRALLDLYYARLDARASDAEAMP